MERQNDGVITRQKDRKQLSGNKRVKVFMEREKREKRWRERRDGERGDGERDTKRE